MKKNLPGFVLMFLVLASPLCAETLRARMAVLPDTIRPGEPFVVAVALPAERAGLFAVLLSPTGRRLGRAPLFVLERGEGVILAAVMALPSLSATGTGRVFVEGWLGGAPASPPVEGAADAAYLSRGLPLEIQNRRFQAEVIDLDRRNTAIRSEPDPQKTREANELWAILARAGSEVFGDGPFVPPVASTRRTSLFGDRRVYRYDTGVEDTSVHAGIDYGVSKGTPVTACAPGRVVLAKERIVTGFSVILEHLPGLYSLYYHLDSLAVEDGALVEAGTLLGHSGATGLATGPHLHWEIRASGENADPDAFIARPLLDRDAIHGLLSGE